MYLMFFKSDTLRVHSQLNTFNSEPSDRYSCQKVKASAKLMLKIYAQTKREMCIEANVCIQNKQLHCIKFTHKFFHIGSYLSI